MSSDALCPIDDALPLAAETDALNFAILSTLNREGRPIAFHSRTLPPAEQQHTSVEKEAYVVVEALRKWRHLLVGRHFTLVTDQTSVSSMFVVITQAKLLRKFMRWRMGLSSFHFTILHRPGRKIIGLDTLSRAFYKNMGTSHLKELRTCFFFSSRITRMAHFVQSKNFSCSLSEIQQMLSECRECQEKRMLSLRNHKKAA